jgi:predicted MFS family arabinose efflux permease
MTLAAKQLSPARFGLWSGVILSIGNIGMLLSSSPLAFVIEQWGWRAGFWISAGLGVAVALAVYALVPNQRAEHADRSSPLSQMASVLRIGLSYQLRGLIAISLVSLAAVLVMRGLWGGPWLMEIKALGRIEAGNMLGLFTLALIAGPVLMGVLDRSIGHRREVLAATHSFAALLLALMAAGAPHYPLSELLGVKAVPVQVDGALLVLIGIAISTQPLLYGMTRQLVDAQNAGKALSAINLAFFLGAALMQSSTGFVATLFGLPAVLLFMAATLIVGTAIFIAYTQPSKS